jgi:hypothetical protein
MKFIFLQIINCENRKEGRGLRKTAPLGGLRFPQMPLKMDVFGCYE